MNNSMRFWFCGCMFSIIVYMICFLLSYTASPVTKLANHVKAARHNEFASMTPTEERVPQPLKIFYKKVYVWLDEKHNPIGWPLERLIRDNKAKGKYSCPGLSCGIQIDYGQNYDQLASSDIVLLYYKSSWNWDELMQYRSEHQKWIFWTFESPIHTTKQVIPPAKYLNKSYDYIMTYRTGATNKKAVLSGAEYGRYVPHAPSPVGNVTRNWANNKTKLVAWVSSNCQVVSWNRREFVRALSRHISVDTFGICGEKPCGNLNNCGIRKYKFYLALENSECRDYITEKFWYNALTLGLVPVVYGAPKEDYIRMAPPNSFIHVQDFPSVFKLAEYLDKLDKNDEMYNKYFEWRKFGSVTTNKEDSFLEPENFCKHVIRHILRDEEQKEEMRMPVVENWREWWTDSCKSALRYERFPIFID